METMNNLEIFDPESNTTYSVRLSAEDLKRAETDEYFVQSLLTREHENTDTENINCCDSEIDENCNNNYNDTEGSQNFVKGKKELNTSWSYEETLALISLIENHYDDLSHIIKRKKIWDIISTEMESLNYMRSARQCQEKWKNLLRTYKSCKDNTSRTGRAPTRFMYLDRIDLFMGEKPSISNANVISVGCENVNKQDASEIPTITESSEFEEDSGSSKSTPQKSASKRKRNLKNSLEEYLTWKKEQAEKRDEERKRLHDEKERRHQEKMALQRDKNELLRQLLSKKGG